MNNIEQVLCRIAENKRLSVQDANLLLNNADLLQLGEMAAKKRNVLCQNKIVTYVVDRNINYTNICMSCCRFCAFYKKVGQAGGYVIKKELLSDKIKETIELGGTQILLQGGMNPELDINYYIDLLTFIKKNFTIHIHGFSPPEIVFISEKSNLSIKEVIKKLISAGLDSIPGGGAEILVDSIREKISPNKCFSKQWLLVMETAHELGLKTTATMMYGHIESGCDIINHLNKIRSLQDKTSGFTAFIPWTFQPENTQLSDINQVSSVYYLKVLAISRLFLDNIDNIQASWVTQGEKIAQLAIVLGANDLGSTMIEENVVAAAGVKFRLSEKSMIRLIKDAGFIPKQRDCFYNFI